MQGMPSLAPSTNGGVWVAARDQWKGYHLMHYAPGTAIEPWRGLGGVFETDPGLSAGADGGSI